MFKWNILKRNSNQNAWNMDDVWTSLEELDRVIELYDSPKSTKKLRPTCSLPDLIDTCHYNKGDSLNSSGTFSSFNGSSNSSHVEKSCNGNKSGPPPPPARNPLTRLTSTQQDSHSRLELLQDKFKLLVKDLEMGRIIISDSKPPNFKPPLPPQPAARTNIPKRCASINNKPPVPTPRVSLSGRSRPVSCIEQISPVQHQPTYKLSPSHSFQTIPPTPASSIDTEHVVQLRVKKKSDASEKRSRPVSDIPRNIYPQDPNHIFGTIPADRCLSLWADDGLYKSSLKVKGLTNKEKRFSDAPLATKKSHWKKLWKRLTHGAAS